MKKATRRKVKRYWNDVRAIKKATGVSFRSARKYYSRNVGKDRGKESRAVIVRRAIAEKSGRTARARKDKKKKPIIDSIKPSAVTLYPREGLPPAPLWDAFTLFDGKENVEILAPLIRALPKGTVTIEAQFEFFEDGEPVGITEIIIMYFGFVGGGNYDLFRSLYYAEIRSLIASVTEDDESPEGHCLLHSLVHDVE